MSEKNRNPATGAKAPSARPNGYARMTPEEAARAAARRAQAAQNGGVKKATAPAGTRPAGSRPTQQVRKTAAAPMRTANNAKRKKKKQKNLFPVVLIILLVLALGIGALLLFGGKGKDTDNTGEPAKTNTNMNTPDATSNGDTATGDGSFAFSKIEGEDQTLPSSGGYSVNVTDLSITKGLDEKWLNVLLLGTDARTLKEPARTDAMIICSIHRETGEVKLASIMRDTNVFFEGHTKNGTRINNAFFYGGPQLAMKVVNECFGLNIEKFVCVNFDGFAVIADMIGGVDVLITENEMKHINKNVMEQYHIMITQGKLDYDVAEKEYFDTMLKTYTTNNDKIHLNGMQALGYARIRKLDSDYARTERQRIVLSALMDKLKGSDVVTLMKLAYRSVPYFSTNLSIEGEILKIAEKVLKNADLTQIDQMHLPITGSYKEETRNNDARLYDMDIEKNTRALHEFIYN